MKNPAVAEVKRDGFPIVTKKFSPRLYAKYNVRGETYIFMKRGKEAGRAYGQLGETRLKSFWMKINWNFFSGD